MLVNVATVKDWDLIVYLCHWSYRTNLRPKVNISVLNEAYRQAWKHTDAYGEVGYIPAQGYDWSGFRDSSKESTAKSAAAIREVLTRNGITEFDAEKESL